MAFRIRPNHERMFSTNIAKIEETSENIEEDDTETVFYVDEETGEIKESKKSDEKKTSVVKSSQPVAPQLPKKDSAKVFGLSMKKRTKVSFM